MGPQQATGLASLYDATRSIIQRSRRVRWHQAECKQWAVSARLVEQVVFDIEDSSILKYTDGLSAVTALKAALAAAEEAVRDCCSVGQLRAIITAGDQQARLAHAAEDLAVAAGLLRGARELGTEQLELLLRIEDSIKHVHCDSHDSLVQRAAALRQMVEASRPEIGSLGSRIRLLTLLNYSEATWEKTRQVELDGLLELLCKEREDGRTDNVQYINQVLNLVQACEAGAAATAAVVPTDSEKVPQNLLCPISYEIMTDPVILVETGHTYERENIESWLCRGHATDPLAGAGVSMPAELIPNHCVRQLTLDWLAAHPSAILAHRPCTPGSVHEPPMTPRHPSPTLPATHASSLPPAEPQQPDLRPMVSRKGQPEATAGAGGVDTDQPVGQEHARPVFISSVGSTPSCAPQEVVGWSVAGGNVSAAYLDAAARRPAHSAGPPSGRPCIAELARQLSTARSQAATRILMTLIMTVKEWPVCRRDFVDALPALLQAVGSGGGGTKRRLAARLLAVLAEQDEPLLRPRLGREGVLPAIPLVADAGDEESVQMLLSALTLLSALDLDLLSLALGPPTLPALLRVAAESNHSAMFRDMLQLLALVPVPGPMLLKAVASGATTFMSTVLQRRRLKASTHLEAMRLAEAWGAASPQASCALAAAGLADSLAEFLAHDDSLLRATAFQAMSVISRGSSSGGSSNDYPQTPDKFHPLALEAQGSGSWSGLLSSTGSREDQGTGPGASRGPAAAFVDRRGSNGGSSGSSGGASTLTAGAARSSHFQRSSNGGSTPGGSVAGSSKRGGVVSPPRSGVRIQPMNVPKGRVFSAGSAPGLFLSPVSLSHPLTPRQEPPVLRRVGSSSSAAPPPRTPGGQSSHVGSTVGKYNSLARPHPDTVSMRAGSVKNVTAGAHIAPAVPLGPMPAAPATVIPHAKAEDETPAAAEQPLPPLPPSPPPYSSPAPSGAVALAAGAAVAQVPATAGDAAAAQLPATPRRLTTPSALSSAPSQVVRDVERARQSPARKRSPTRLRSTTSRINGTLQAAGLIPTTHTTGRAAAAAAAAVACSATAAAGWGAAGAIPRGPSCLALPIPQVAPAPAAAAVALVAGRRMSRRIADAVQALDAAASPATAAVVAASQPPRRRLLLAPAADAGQQQRPRGIAYMDPDSVRMALDLNSGGYRETLRRADDWAHGQASMLAQALSGRASLDSACDDWQARMAAGSIGGASSLPSSPRALPPPEPSEFGLDSSKPSVAAAAGDDVQPNVGRAAAEARPAGRQPVLSSLRAAFRSLSIRASEVQRSGVHPWQRRQ